MAHDLPNMAIGQVMSNQTPSEHANQSDFGSCATKHHQSMPMVTPKTLMDAPTLATLQPMQPTIEPSQLDSAASVTSVIAQPTGCRVEPSMSIGSAQSVAFISQVMHPQQVHVQPQSVSPETAAQLDVFHDHSAEVGASAMCRSSPDISDAWRTTLEPATAQGTSLQFTEPTVNGGGNHVAAAGAGVICDARRTGADDAVAPSASPAPSGISVTALHQLASVASTHAKLAPNPATPPSDRTPCPVVTSTLCVSQSDGVISAFGEPVSVSDASTQTGSDFDSPLSPCVTPQPPGMDAGEVKGVEAVQMIGAVLLAGRDVLLRCAMCAETLASVDLLRFHYMSKHQGIIVKPEPMTPVPIKTDKKFENKNYKTENDSAETSEPEDVDDVQDEGGHWPEQPHEATNAVPGSQPTETRRVRWNGVAANSAGRPSRSVRHKRGRRHQPYAARRAVCPICRKQLSSVAKLRVHQRTHTGERPFACRYCAKRCNDPGNLRKHERLHFKPRPFSCSVCGLTFWTEHQQYRHVCQGAFTQGGEAGEAQHVAEACFTERQSVTVTGAGERATVDVPIAGGELVNNVESTGAGDGEGSVGRTIGAVDSTPCAEGAGNIHEQHVNVTVMRRGAPVPKLGTCGPPLNPAIPDPLGGFLAPVGGRPTFRRLVGCPYCNRVGRESKKTQRHIAGHFKPRPFSCSTCAITFLTEKKKREHRCRYGSKVANEQVPLAVPPALQLPPSGMLPPLADPETSSDNPPAMLVTMPPPLNYITPPVTVSAPFNPTALPAIVPPPVGYIPMPMNAPPPLYSAAPLTSAPTSLNPAAAHMAVSSALDPAVPCQAFPPPLEHIYVPPRARPAASGRGEPSPLVAGKRRDHICPVCGKAMLSYASLEMHYRTHTGERPYQCAECGKRFSIHGNLVVHLRRHSGERPYQCEQCGRTFMYRSHLKVHARQHSGARPYQCRFCRKAFAASSTCRVHESTVHSDERKFICETCGVGFKEKKHLRRHRWKKHQLDTE